VDSPNCASCCFNPILEGLSGTIEEAQSALIQLATLFQQKQTPLSVLTEQRFPTIVFPQQCFLQSQPLLRGFKTGNCSTTSYGTDMVVPYEHDCPERQRTTFKETMRPFGNSGKPYDSAQATTRLS
jgi:hypothetical protein